MENSLINNKIDKKKKRGRFARAMRFIFVHNFGYKVLSLVVGVIVWILVVAI